MTRTTFATKDDQAKAMSTWFVVDASQHVLGRMAARIAEALMGKDKPLYTPHINVGSGVIVINASQISVSGNKRQGKVYRHYTGYVGGLKDETLQEALDRNPERLITLAVRRMLPKNRSGRDMLRRLKVYSGTDHPHVAQSPEPLQF